jgi:lipoprotein-anchoring transpeptidase ErfK/SrfK
MRARTVIAVSVLLAPLTLCGCSGGGGSGQETSVDAATLVSISPAAPAKGAAAPDVPVVVTAVHGTLTDVTVTTADGRRLGGSLAADDRSWRSDGMLSAGQHYLVRVSADDGDGGRGSTVDSFSTSPAPQALSVELTPGDHAVYGVGEPITAALSLPVHDPAARKVVEAGLTVDSSPSVTGSWYWVDDKTLHFRPEQYWPAHATISASYDLSGRHIGGDVYGGAPSRISFATGDKMLAYTDAASDYLTVYRNGDEIRSIPVTTGKPGFSTRSGIKVVLEQSPMVFMNSSTVGIAADSSDAYHKDVAWDTRVTWSGEYVHAAPWSVGSQGVANTSHGCTGMSTGNARWFYDTFRRGDLVQVVHSYGHQMEPFGNGFGDWNLSWSDWQQGSALHRIVQTAPDSVQQTAPVGFLRPQA